MALRLLQQWPMASIRTIRLLVVEDSPAYLYLIQKEFRKRAAHTNWDLTVAKDGEEALHLLFEEEEGGAAALPDLILLDWNLPKVSGRDVLRRVKEHGSLRKIPVLVFSSSAEDGDIHSAYGAHANVFITKPGDNHALATIVSTIEQFWIAVAQLPKVVRA
jgi:two-component system, chemotaxis family, response regulator Rcp1